LKVLSFNGRDPTPFSFLEHACRCGGRCRSCRGHDQASPFPSPPAGTFRGRATSGCVCFYFAKDPFMSFQEFQSRASALKHRLMSAGLSFAPSVDPIMAPLSLLHLAFSSFVRCAHAFLRAWLFFFPFRYTWTTPTANQSGLRLVFSVNYGSRRQARPIALPTNTANLPPSGTDTFLFEFGSCVSYTSGFRVSSPYSIRKSPSSPIGLVA